MANQHGLHRALSSRQLSMIAMGGAIGTGLFLGSAVAISKAGPGVILAYALGAFVAFAIAWALAEMAVVHPTAGSFGAIAHTYLGPWAGFVSRWSFWAAQIVAIGGEVIAAGLYMRFWWPELPLWLPVVLFSVAMLAVNAMAVRFFGEFEYWFAVIKVVAIVAFILLGVVYVVVGLPDHDAAGISALTGHGGFLPNGIGGVWLAMAVVIFSFLGTEVVAVAAAESRDPVRDVPRAARRMIVRLSLFYVLAISIVVAILPWTDAARYGEVTTSPFVRLLDLAGIDVAAGLINFVVITAALSSMNTNLYLTARMAHSLARDGYAPDWMGRTTPGGVPRNSLILSAAGLAVAAFLAWRFEGSAFLALFGVALFGGITVWTLIFLTHIAFRRRRAALGLPPSPVRMWGAPWTSAAGALVLIAVLVTMAFMRKENLHWSWYAGVPFLLILTVAFLGVSRTRRPRPDADLIALERQTREGTPP